MIVSWILYVDFTIGKFQSRNLPALPGREIKNDE